MPRAYFLVVGSNPGPFALWDYTRRARIPLVINDEQPLPAWLSWSLKARRRHIRGRRMDGRREFGRQPAKDVSTKAKPWDQRHFYVKGTVWTRTLISSMKHQSTHRHTSTAHCCRETFLHYADPAAYPVLVHVRFLTNVGEAHVDCTAQGPTRPRPQLGKNADGKFIGVGDRSQRLRHSQEILRIQNTGTRYVCPVARSCEGPGAEPESRGRIPALKLRVRSGCGQR